MSADDIPDYICDPALMRAYDAGGRLICLWCEELGDAAYKRRYWALLWRSGVGAPRVEIEEFDTYSAALAAWLVALRDERPAFVTKREAVWRHLALMTPEDRRAFSDARALAGREAAQWAGLTAG